jgi:DNA-binding FadR family transcriptional regulator
VRVSVRSVWTLELLLAMRRSGARAWSPAELVRELRASDAILRDGLAVLQAAGLVAPEPAGLFRYAPASKRLDDLVEALAEAYRDRPSSVTRVIFEPSDARLQSFADAFRLKRD